MTRTLLAALLGAALAAAAIRVFAPTDLPDRVLELQAAIHTLVPERDSAIARAKRDSLARAETDAAFADSSAVWAARLDSLEVRAERADAEHGRLLSRVADAALADSLAAAHETAMAAERGRTATAEAEVRGLEEKVAADSALIVRLYARIEVTDSMLAVTEQVNRELRAELGRRQTRGKVTELVAIGALGKIAWDAFLGGDGGEG